MSCRCIPLVAPDGPVTEAQWAASLAPNGACLHWKSMRSAIAASGVSPSLRPEVWPLLLGVLDPGADSATRARLREEQRAEYAQLTARASDAAEASSSFSTRGGAGEWAAVLKGIDVDVPRTDAEYFAAPGSAGASDELRRILRAYALADPRTGYCQGMADLASAMLQAAARDEAGAFALFRALLQRRLRPLFADSCAGLRPHFRRVAQIVRARGSRQAAEPKLHAAICRAFGGDDWVFLMRPAVVYFRRELPPDTGLVMWERLWAIEGDVRGGGLHAYAAAALCVLLGKQLAAARGPDELLRAFNDVGRGTGVSGGEWVDLTVRLHRRVGEKMRALWGSSAGEAGEGPPPAQQRGA